MSACTEKEAAEKWCPHMRKAIVDTDGSLFAGNMSADGSFAPITCCIGSRCMQWRWLDLHRQEPVGYCGLAGKP